MYSSYVYYILIFKILPLKIGIDYAQYSIS
jgi:hypothetical protein